MVIFFGKSEFSQEVNGSMEDRVRTFFFPKTMRQYQLFGEKKFKWKDYMELPLEQCAMLPFIAYLWYIRSYAYIVLDKVLFLWNLERVSGWSIIWRRKMHDKGNSAPLFPAGPAELILAPGSFIYHIDATDWHLIGIPGFVFLVTENYSNVGNSSKIFLLSYNISYNMKNMQEPIPFYFKHPRWDSHRRKPMK